MFYDVLSSLLRHPGLVSVLGFCESTPQPYILNEFVEGTTLKVALAEPQTWQRKLKWVHTEALRGRTSCYELRTTKFVRTSYALRTNFTMNFMSRELRTHFVQNWSTA